MRKLILGLMLGLVLLLTGCGSTSASSTQGFNSASEEYIKEGVLVERKQAEKPVTNPLLTLNVPTYITKIGEEYFIVDCYNNQVIYSDSLNRPLQDWLVMTSEINMGHTIASDGEVYLIDDTENNRILVMRRNEASSGFYISQIFDDIGIRPHFVAYDADTDSFYAWSSMTGQMYIFRHDRSVSSVFLTKVVSVPELDGYYVRTFTIDGKLLYLVSGDGNIYELDKHSFEVLGKYPVPISMYGMVQIMPIDDWFYITISTDGYGNQDYATIIRTKELTGLISDEYEDVYESFIGGGTPYCITRIDEYYYLCEHRLPGHSVWRFEVKEGQIQNPVTIY